MADDNDPLIAAAQGTVQSLKDRWDGFREDCGTSLNEYLDQGFGYVEGVLGDDSTPTDWIKGGMALWIRSFGVTRSLCNAAFRFVSPPKDET
jgi:hypothetical protein